MAVFTGICQECGKASLAMESGGRMTAEKATKILADEAEKPGADANDCKGIVRQLVATHGLGFCAWFCICCELADRAAQREGYKNQVDRALNQPGFQKALAAYIAEKN